MSDSYTQGINTDTSGVKSTMTAAGTITGTGITMVDSTAGAMTLVLPPATIGAGAIVTLVGTNADLGNVITVNAGAGDSVNGIGTMTTAVNPSQSYISDGLLVWVAFPYAV